MKRQSSTNEPPDLTYFVDADLCGAPFLTVLSEARILFESHNEHFEHGTPDEDWLPTAGRNGWPVLTHDKRIYRNDFRLRTLMESGVRVFVLIGDPSKNPSGVKGGFLMGLAENFVNCRLMIERMIRKYHPDPFVAKVYRPNASHKARVRCVMRLEQWLKR